MFCCFVALDQRAFGICTEGLSTSDCSERVQGGCQLTQLSCEDIVGPAESGMLSTPATASFLLLLLLLLLVVVVVVVVVVVLLLLLRDAHNSNNCFVVIVVVDVVVVVWGRLLRC